MWIFGHFLWERVIFQRDPSFLCTISLNPAQILKVIFRRKKSLQKFKAKSEKKGNGAKTEIREKYPMQKGNEKKLFLEMRKQQNLMAT